MAVKFVIFLSFFIFILFQFGSFISSTHVLFQFVRLSTDLNLFWLIFLTMAWCDPSILFFFIYFKELTSGLNFKKTQGRKGEGGTVNFVISARKFVSEVLHLICFAVQQKCTKTSSEKDAYSSDKKLAMNHKMSKKIYVGKGQATHKPTPKIARIIHNL